MQKYQFSVPGLLYLASFQKFNILPDLDNHRLKWAISRTSQSQGEKVKIVRFSIQLKLQLSQTVLDPSYYGSPGEGHIPNVFFSGRISAAESIKHSLTISPSENEL